MAADNDIHPLAPAGGGGAGSFAGVGPVGMSRKMDKWLSPGPIGVHKPKIPIDRKALRRAENEELLKNKNIKAFLAMTGRSEGGDYHAKFGWIKGNNEWTFTDESRHPGAGKGGHTTAAGLYQINMACWTEHGVRSQGLTDFSPHTQDLIAIDNIRQFSQTTNIIEGDIRTPITVLLNRKQWTSFRIHSYKTLEAWYIEEGGTLK